MRFLPVLFLLLITACTAREPAPKPAPRNDPLSRACRYLWKQQAHDGGWHSNTYGLMKSGQSLTPFVLHALLEVPKERREEPDGAVQRALAFLRAHVNADGALGMADEMVMDYPTHATAYAVRCLVRAGYKEDRALIERMCAWLARQQFGAGNGFDEKHPAHGGFGFGGTKVTPANPGIMDVAHTRRALQALREAGRADAEICARAEAFLRLVQRHAKETRPQPQVPGEPEGKPGDSFDGGFYFSPVVLGMNKGLHEKPAGDRGAYFRSYATATCDGLLALLAAGVNVEDSRVTAARQWLADHPALEAPAGIPDDAPTPWHVALFHYHLAVRAEAYAALNVTGDWRKNLAELLARDQLFDGSFANAKSPLMKEDDPLLCTALAVIALSRCS